MFFVGGIHGTGKSVFASKMATELGLTHVSASDIIHQQKIATKNVEDVNKNQNTLVSGFYGLPAGKYIIDGHYTLLDKENSVVRVPLEVFSLLKPKRIIILISDIEKIHARLLKRDGVRYSLDILRNMQIEEESYYLELCKYLNSDVEIIDNNF